MDYLQKIDYYREKRGMSRYDLSVTAGLSANTVSTWYNNKKSRPTVEALQKVCEVLEISFAGLFMEENDNEMDSEKLYLLNLWDNLSPKDKEAILIVLKKFSREETK